MSLKKLCILLLLPALAQAAEPQPSASLPAPPQTLEEARAQQLQAAQMRREADQKRDIAESARAHDDAACRAKILVNACREDVRKAYIQAISVVRQLEIDANQIDRVAKSRQLELEAALKRPPEPTASPRPAASQPAEPMPPKPGAKPLSSPSTPKPAPAAAVAPAAQAKADAERARRNAAAERQQQARNTDASARARKAREDAERYARRAREQAEKKARKASASAPAGKP